METGDEGKLPDSHVLAQMSYDVPVNSFVTLTLSLKHSYLPGTTANALTRALHLLVTHPEAQDRLRDEVKLASSDSNMTYDKLDSWMHSAGKHSVCQFFHHTINPIIDTIVIRHPPVTVLTRV